MDDAGTEHAGGWLAVDDEGFVEALGGGEPPDGDRVDLDRVDLGGALVTPGLVNTHHHIFQNLTRSFAPVVNADLLTWLHVLGQTWVRLDEEASYV
ncbi:MAG: 8-oxoguanine deaminase, partial [Thermoleophilia bacterium]|nr:8-oxoguanine deaminase [Thermoleophilia bacterium]